MTNSETTGKASTVAEPGAHVAPEKATSKNGADQKKGAPKVMKSAKAPTTKKKAPQPARAQKRPTEARSNKKAKVIAMMIRAKGAMLAEITKATGWQRHTVRGFVSILGSKGGEKIESAKNAAGERTYPHGQNIHAARR
jgi:hypothetical protein